MDGSAITVGAGIIEKSLDELAADIKATLEHARTNEKKADNLRIAAGKMLLEARQRVESEHAQFKEMRRRGESPHPAPTWLEWRRRHFKRSDRDIRRCLRLAKSPDPEAAHHAEKEASRKGMQATRAKEAKRTNVSPAAVAPQTTRTKSPEEIAADVADARAIHIKARYGIMISAWDMSPEEARSQFLDKIGAILKVRLVDAAAPAGIAEGPDEDDDNLSPEDVAKPPSMWAGRAQSAAVMAAYAPVESCPVTQTMLVAAEKVVKAWSEVVNHLEKELNQGGEVQALLS